MGLFDAFYNSVNEIKKKKKQIQSNAGMPKVQTPRRDVGNEFINFFNNRKSTSTVNFESRTSNLNRNNNTSTMGSFMDSQKSRIEEFIKQQEEKKKRQEITNNNQKIKQQDNKYLNSKEINEEIEKKQVEKILQKTNADAYIKYHLSTTKPKITKPLSAEEKKNIIDSSKRMEKEIKEDKRKEKYKAIEEVGKELYGITKKSASTANLLVNQAVEGALKGYESIDDFILYKLASASEKIEDENSLFKDKEVEQLVNEYSKQKGEPIENKKLSTILTDIAKQDVIDTLNSKTQKKLENDSVIKDADSNILTQSASEVGKMLAMNKLGGALQGVSKLGTAINSSKKAKAAGKAISMIPFAGSVAGSSSDKALKEGATLDEAMKYAELNAVVETAIELFSGGIAGLAGNKLRIIKDLSKSGKFGKIGISTFNTLKKLSRSTKGEIGIKVGEKVLDVTGEGFEEMASEFIEPYLRRMTYDEKAELASREDYKNAFIGAVITSTIANTGLSLFNTKTGKEVKLSKKEFSELVKQDLLEDMNNEQNNKLSDSSIRKENNISNIDSIDNTNITQNGISEVSEKITKNNNINEENLQYSIDNNSNLLENKFPISKKITEKDNIKTTAQRYFDMTKDTTKKIVDTIERFQDTRNKNATNGNLKIVFDDTVKGNGIITKDTNGNRLMRINPNSNKSYEFIVVHEMTHDLEGTAEYKELQEVVKEFTGKGFAYEQAKADLEKRYNEFYDKNGLDKKDLNIESEAMGDILGTVLGDQKFINEVSRKKPNVAKRIVNWINKFIDIHRSKGSDREFKEYLYKIKDSFRKAFEANNIVENKTNYSIQVDGKGNKYVKVDTDQDIFDGISEKDYNKIAKMYMQDYLKGEHTIAKNDKVEIGSKGINKYTNPQQNTAYFKEKMRLSTELKNVLEISQKVSSGVPTKSTTKFPNWEYYKINFEIGGKNFEGLINIGIDKNGDRKFYEINKIHTIRNIVCFNETKK